jgi:hypothetical protein
MSSLPSSTAVFSYTWNNATPGDHTVTSRVADVNGNVRPTSEDLESKLTFLEHNAQHPRALVIQGYNRRAGSPDRVWTPGQCPARDSNPEPTD